MKQVYDVEFYDRANPATFGAYRFVTVVAGTIDSALHKARNVVAREHKQAGIILPRTVGVRKAILVRELA